MKKFLNICLSLLCLMFIVSLVACGKSELNLADYEVGYELHSDFVGEKEVTFYYEDQYSGGKDYTFYITSFSATLNTVYTEDDYPDGVEHPCEVLIVATGYTDSSNANMEVRLTYMLSNSNCNWSFPTSTVQNDGTIQWESLLYCDNIVTIFGISVEI